MPTALRSFAAWIAIACLAFGSLWPLASLAAARTPASAMAICSTGAGWQTPASMPGQSGTSGHAHCSYCSSNDQAYSFELLSGNIGAFRTTLVYFIQPATQRTTHPYLLRADSWARAPPLV